MKTSTSKSKSWKGKGAAVILPLCEIVVGILLLINPSGFTRGIIMAVGILLVLLGVKDIVGYFRGSQQTSFGRGLSKGLLECIGGAFCAFNPQWFTATFPVLTMLYGVCMLITGVMKVETTANMLRAKRRGWGWCTLGAALSIICAVIILSNPFASSAVLWVFVAVSLIVEAIVDFVAALLPQRAQDGKAA